MPLAPPGFNGPMSLQSAVGRPKEVEAYAASPASDGTRLTDSQKGAFLRVDAQDHPGKGTKGVEHGRRNHGQVEEAARPEGPRQGIVPK